MSEQPPALQGRRHTNAVLNEVLKERDAQNEKWGGPDHDDEHGPRDWAAFIVKHLGKAIDADEIPHKKLGPMSIEDRKRCHEERSQTYRKQLVHVAGLAVAAIEAFDRRKR